MNCKQTCLLLINYMEVRTFVMLLMLAMPLTRGACLLIMMRGQIIRDGLSLQYTVGTNV